MITNYESLFDEVNRDGIDGIAFPGLRCFIFRDVSKMCLTTLASDLYTAQTETSVLYA